MTTLAETEQSIARYERYVNSDPHNALLWLNLGDQYHKGGRFDEAIASYERAQIESPESSAARSRIASVYISQHRFDQAEQLLLGFLAQKDGDVALIYNLGLTQFYQEKWDAAYESFSRALALGLRSDDNLAYLTRTLHHLGKTREAIEFCNQWAEQANNSASSGYLALLEMDDGNMPRARELAQQVLARDPSNNDAAAVVGTWSVEEQEMEQAEGLFNAILSRQPNNPRAWLGLGLVRMYQQKHSEAIPALERAVQLMPTNVGTIVALGWAHLAARDAVTAEKTFRNAVNTDHNFAEAHGGLASALALQVKVKEAHTAAQIADRLDPANFGAKFAQSVLLTIHGKNEVAKRLLSRVLEHAPAPHSKPLIEHLRLYGARQLKSTQPETPKQPPP